MKRKKLFISLTAVCAVLVFLGIFVLMWYVGDSYKDFKKFSKEFAIEGLDDGAVPQGMTAYPSNYVYDVDETGKEKVKPQQYFLVSSYMSDGSASRIYVTVQLTDDKNKVTGYRYIGFVTLENEDGTPHLGHVGGIATNGAFLWVGHDDNVLVATASSKDYENILREIILKAQINLSGEAEEIQSVKFTSSFKANCNASFMVYFDDARYTDITYDRLYVGEFYRKGNYETDKSHRIETPNGYKNSSGRNRQDAFGQCSQNSENFLYPRKDTGRCVLGKKGQQHDFERPRIDGGSVAELRTCKFAPFMLRLEISDGKRKQRALPFDRRRELRL